MKARLLGIALIATLTGSCYRWAPEVEDPQRMLREEPGRVRVVMEDGSVVVDLREPRLVGDSLIGFERRGGTTSRRAIALADVQLLYTRRLDRGATVTAAALAGAGVAVVYTIIKAVGSERCDFCSDTTP